MRPVGQNQARRCLEGVRQVASDSYSVWLSQSECDISLLSTISLLYLPSERSETGGYTVLLAFPFVRPSVCTHI